MNSHNESKKTLPELETCPITKKGFSEMKKPVVGPGGNVYDEEDIATWIKMKPTDPMTVIPVTLASYYNAQKIIDPLIKAYEAHEEALATIEAYKHENQQLKEQLANNQRLIQQQIADILKTPFAMRADKKNNNSTLPRRETQLLSDISIHIQEKEKKLNALIIARFWLLKRFKKKLTLAENIQSNLQQNNEEILAYNKTINDAYKKQSNDLTNSFALDATEDLVNNFFKEQEKLNHEWKEKTTINLNMMKKFQAKSHIAIHHAFAKAVLVRDNKDILGKIKNSKDAASFFKHVFSLTGSLKEKNILLKIFELTERINLIYEDIEKLKEVELTISKSLTETLTRERTKKSAANSNKKPITQPVPSAPLLDAKEEIPATPQATSPKPAIENENKREDIITHSVTEVVEIPFVAQLPHFPIQTTQQTPELRLDNKQQESSLLSRDKKPTPEEQRTLNEALISAVEQRDLNMLKVHLEQGANPNAKKTSDNTYRPALSLCMIKFDYVWDEGIQTLIESKADVDALDINDNSPLHWAAGFHAKKAVKTLLDHKANATLFNSDNEQPYETAVKSFNARPELTKRPNVFFALLKSAEQSQLPSAFRTQSQSSTEQLASSSSQVNHQPSAPLLDNSSGISLLYPESQNKPADMKQQTQNMSSKSASLTLFAPKLKQLNPTEQKEYDDKLISAMMERNLEMFKYFLLKGANPNLRFYQHINGMVPLTSQLIIKYRDNWNEGLKALLSHNKLNINASDGCSATALHWAAYYHLESTVKILLDHKANPTVVNIYSQTPLREMSNHPEHPNLVALLTKAMKDWEINHPSSRSYQRSH